MRKYSKQEQRTMAAWAADCAERVLPFFEELSPKDERPRRAIEACRTWVRTGVFKMADIRQASLAAHAAARKAKARPAACFAARAAGHAVATAHVPQHAFGAASYALKAVTAAAEARAAEERMWQARHLLGHLRREFLKRVVVRNQAGRVLVRVLRDKDF